MQNLTDVFQNSHRKKLLKGSLIIIILILTIVFILRIMMRGGEQYTREGEALGAEINKELMSLGFCKNASECHKELEIYAAHGNHVNFSIYSPKNKEMLWAVTKLIMEKGIQITNGVPISVKVFPKSRAEYGDIWKEPEPIIQLEIKS